MLTVIDLQCSMVSHLILEQTCFVACVHVGIVIQDCVHAVWVSCNINVRLSCWITEASSWTPSCHATMWTECDHPLAREPDWAKGISHRHANSTNAPVRPKWQMLSAMGFSFSFFLFLHVCVTQPCEREVCSSSCVEIAEHVLLMWCGSFPWLQRPRLPSWEEFKHCPGTGSLSSLLPR